MTLSRMAGNEDHLYVMPATNLVFTHQNQVFSSSSARYSLHIDREYFKTLFTLFVSSITAMVFSRY